MADPRNSPRSFCAEPHLFGKAEMVTWRETPPELQVKLRAAQLQHLYAVRISGLLRAKNKGLGWYADRVGRKYDRMTKLLRGVLPMRLDDIAAADVLLGAVSELAIRDQSTTADNANTSPGRRQN